MPDLPRQRPINFNVEPVNADDDSDDEINDEEVPLFLHPEEEQEWRIERERIDLEETNQLLEERIEVLREAHEELIADYNLLVDAAQRLVDAHEARQAAAPNEDVNEQPLQAQQPAAPVPNGGLHMPRQPGYPVQVRPQLIPPFPAAQGQRPQVPPFPQAHPNGPNRHPHAQRQQNPNGQRPPPNQGSAGPYWPQG